MSLPTSPVDANLPKGPNFLGIVIGFGIAILIVLVVAWVVLGHRGKKIFPMNTRQTPSQTRLDTPRDLPGSVVRSGATMVS